MELIGQGGSAGRARIGVLGWRSVELKAGGSEELLRGQSHGADRTGGVCRQSENWSVRLEECRAEGWRIRGVTQRNRMELIGQGGSAGREVWDFRLKAGG